MTFLTIEQINSNPNHAPIDDEINFINRMKAEIIKTFLGLSIHRKINAKTVPNEYYRKVILRFTYLVIITDDVGMAEDFPRYDITYDEECGGVDQGWGCDWNEKAAAKGTTKEVRKYFKELAADIRKGDCIAYHENLWDEAMDFISWDAPCPIIGYNSDPDDEYDSKNVLRYYKKKGWLK
jgi:hypothetical protein